MLNEKVKKPSHFLFFLKNLYIFASKYIFMTKKLKYSYDDCYNAAKQCDSLKEFRARFNAIRQFSDKHGYTKTFDWLKKRASPGFWTKELAVEESKKYTTRAEFKEKNQYVYILSYKMGWLEEMDWLDTYILTKKSVFKRAKKYTTVKDFNKNEPRAYQKSLKNGWLKEMDWLEPTVGTVSNPYWTFEKVKEVSSKCICKQEFHDKYVGAYSAAKRNGWLNDLSLPEYILNERVYFVYSYVWDNLMVAYVGLSYRHKERDDEHHGLGKYKNNPNKSPVYKFSAENNVSIPEVKYHYENLTLEEAQELEDKVKKEYIDKGYEILNKGATGKGIGSYGNVGIKWNRESVYREAKKYRTSQEFFEKSKSAYAVSRKHKWFKDYYWMVFGHKKLSINECIERAEKYQTRTEFYKNDSNAYKFLCTYSKESLDKIFGSSKTKAFSIEECVDIAKKYNSRSELARSHSGVYAKLRKNNILDKLFPIFNSNKEQELVMAESVV